MLILFRFLDSLSRFLKHSSAAISLGEPLGTLGVIATLVFLLSVGFYKIFLDMKETVFINSKGYKLGITYLKV